MSGWKRDGGVLEQNNTTYDLETTYPVTDKYNFFRTRSKDDDDNDRFGIYQCIRESGLSSHPDDYCGMVGFDESDHLNDLYHSHPIGDIDGLEQLSAQILEEIKGTAGRSDRQGDDYETALYDIHSTGVENLDFENNGLLWLPPDAEDEKESLAFDDEDDGYSKEEWGCSSLPSSVSSKDFHHKEKSSEEQINPMKDAVREHFRSLILQLLKVENLSLQEKNGKGCWLDVVTSLSWEVAANLKPDTSRDGVMDPGCYVKVKCVACGKRSDSVLVRGVVCKKNVAHRRMMSKIDKPRLLILGGALEYHRVSSHLSSVNTLLRQETDHLKMAVAKIDSHKPNILLVENSVSRYAQECLLEKRISLVLNIKRQLLDRIARCTGSQILPSIDHSDSPKLGHCDLFSVERYFEEHGSAGKGGKKMTKTLMFFKGCPKPLGYTVLLKGAHGDELKKVKHVLQYGVFAAYHLALETSFLADEGASLPGFPGKGPINADNNDSPETNLSPSLIKHQSNSSQCNQHSLDSEQAAVSFSYFHCKDQLLNYSEGVNHKRDSNFTISSEDNETLSASGTVTNFLCTSRILEDHICCSPSSESHLIQNGVLECVSTKENELIQNAGTRSMKEGVLPSPSEDQNILVSLATRCVWKGIVCERAHFIRVKYYGSSDKPLGRFLKDDLFDQNNHCQCCEQPPEAHIHYYTHRQGSLTISVTKLVELILPREKEGKIWMWHRCLRCPRANGFPPATHRVAMSEAAWGFSFGKFLELSFSNDAVACTFASCGHSLHRDCLRFYGSGRMVACFRYAPVDVYSVHPPASRIVFNYEKQEWIQKEAMEVKNKFDLFFDEVNNLLKKTVKSGQPESQDSNMKGHELKKHGVELDRILTKEKEEFEESLKRAQNREGKLGGPFADILELNRLRRQLIFQSYVWDQRLLHVSNLQINASKEETSSELVETNGVAKIDIALNDDNPESVYQKPGNNDIRGGPNNPIEQPSGSPKEANVDHEIDYAIGMVQTDVQSPPGSNLSGADGDNQPDVNKNKKSGPERPASPSTAVQSEGSLENTSSWLAIPFLSFYRSFNRSSSFNRHKLDAVKGYNPAYVTSFKKLECQEGARLVLPVGVNDTIVAVYDDEPSSIISYALLSPDYHNQISNDVNAVEKGLESSNSMPFLDLKNPASVESSTEVAPESLKSFLSAEESILSLSRLKNSLNLDPLFCGKPLHTKVSFSDEGPPGKVKYTVITYFAKRFEALRQFCCPSKIDFLRSLSRCKKWGAQGGKSNVFFAKTLDDRFVIKQLTKTEVESFIKFAPAYFKYLSESISFGRATCLAKILGVYQVSKQLKGGKETKMDVLVMENLMFRRNVSRVYDLKGSSRSRYNPDSSGENKVLLDQNLLETMSTSPIFMGNKAKRLLERAVWNDTSFLASVDVMDYSLLVGMDEERQELVVGIIDFMRQYTWDKHLETWVKASGILGGAKNASPTVISPIQYKKRFRKAISSYFLVVPDPWTPMMPLMNATASTLDIEAETAR